MIEEAEERGGGGRERIRKMGVRKIGRKRRK